MQNALQSISRHGLLLPVLALPLGALLPDPAVAMAVLPFAVVAVVMANVLMAEPGRASGRETAAVALLIGLNLLVTPILLHLAVGLLGLPPLLGWVVVVAAGPVAASTVAAAAALEQPVRPMILASVGTVLLLPVTLPLIVPLALPDAGLDETALLVRAGALVLLPAVLAMVLRRLPGVRSARARPSLRGVAVLALSLIALAQGGAMPAALAATRAEDAWLLAGGTTAALALSGLFAAAAGRLLGRGPVLAFGLGGACRNMSLVWAALGPWLTAEGLFALMFGLLVTFVVPAAAPLARTLLRARQLHVVTPRSSSCATLTG